MFVLAIIILTFRASGVTGLTPYTPFYCSKHRACYLDGMRPFVIRLPTAPETEHFQGVCPLSSKIPTIFQLPCTLLQLALVHDSGQQLDHPSGIGDKNRA